MSVILRIQITKKKDYIQHQGTKKANMIQLQIWIEIILFSNFDDFKIRLHTFMYTMKIGLI